MRALVWRRFRKHKPAMFSAAVLAVIVLGCVFVPLILGYDPYNAPVELRRQPPSLTHLFGTDELGRDLMMRIWVGGRVSLVIGVAAVFIAITIGTLVGAIAGFYGGKIDNALMRFNDFMLAIPNLFILLIVAQLLRSLNLPELSGGPLLIIVIIGALSWNGAARLVRGQFLSLKAKEFVDAARMSGAKDNRIIWRHILPNAASPIIVSATLRVGNAILTESTLSFLGFGIQPPMPTWGNMLKNAQSQMVIAPWIAIFPGLFIFLTVVAINYLGDGLRDALDPRHVE
ncbi:MAG: ABC transporter permease [Chloroflexi bacterium]|nr:ABC transporter permease [Chloroflexota bacterium]